MNISFIGGGNMASALIGGLLEKGFTASQLRVVEVLPDARERLAHRFGVLATADPAEGLRDAEAMVLAVKPQQLAEVARRLAPLVGGRLVVSIAAGIRAGDISRWLGGHRRLVRAMPNTPALIQAGITGLYALPGVDAEDRRRAESVLAAVGVCLWLDREELMDGVTAVSASGPAYVFYFIEALHQAALELGFDREQARKLSLETFLGAGKLASGSEEDPATLRARVTSKGGTTERAIATMEAASVKDHIVRAVKAASERARELGDEFGRQ
ncbi:MAG: pyrroline-5-carboxylate reductase [Betaproteobacteria bacterium]|nr:pyrroline-5-carboxylate reductase [Betaproteobacteria bacterium]